MAWDDTKGGGDNDLTATEYNNMVTDQKTRITALSEDSSPTLGGNLDVSTYNVGSADSADLTKLSEMTATSTELNFVDGVTSAIQTQLDSITTSNLMITVGTTGSGADYICDGTADHIQIQSAIDDAETAGGGSVLLLAGTYNTSDDINMKTDVHLSGQGYATIIFLANASNTHVFQNVDEDRWSVKNLKIDVNGTNQTGSGWGFWNRACEYCVVENVWVLNPRTGFGCWTCYNPDAVVGSRGDPSQSCMFIGCKGENKTGTTFTTDMFLTQKAHNCGFINCIATGTKHEFDNGFGLYGISGEADTASQGIFAIGCEAYDNTNGYNLEFNDSGIISGCVAYDNTRAGFNSSDSSNGTITGCVSYNNLYGMTIDADTESLTVTGCTLSQNDDYGAYIGGKYVQFTGNVVNENGTHGIFMEDADFITINNNVFKDNGFTTTWKAAIQAQQCESLKVQNNQILDTAGTYTYKGIYCTGAMAYCMITGNNIDNMYDNGIEVRTGVTYSLVANNIVTNNTTYGIEYSSGTNTGLDVRDNIFDGNGTDEHAPP